MPTHPRPIRNFLTLVGVLSSGLVVALLLLNGLFPNQTRVECVNPVSGETGSAARGRGNLVVSQKSLTDFGGVEHRRESQPELTCRAVFGEGWTDVRRK